MIPARLARDLVFARNPGNGEPGPEHAAHVLGRILTRSNPASFNQSVEMKRALSAVAICLLGMACGEKAAPTAPPPVTNAAPSITSMSITEFGIVDLSQFTYAASATDPDGDSLTYAWDFAGTAAAGSSGQSTFGNGATTRTATLTVSDGKGGRATNSRTFIVGSMTGDWAAPGPHAQFHMTLSQAGGAVYGRYVDVSDGDNFVSPPGVQGTITLDGIVEFHITGADRRLTFRGQMDPTGRRIVGAMFGSYFDLSFNGQSCLITKQGL